MHWPWDSLALEGIDDVEVEAVTPRSARSRRWREAAQAALHARTAAASRAGSTTVVSAGWLSELCFECLRHLWDDTDTDLTIVFTGGNGCFEMLQREPMLESRVYAWQEIGGMPLDEVLTVVPAFHPCTGAGGP